MPVDIQQRLGARVRELRLRRGLTQEQLGERCGYTVKFISTVERGLVNVPLRTLANVAGELGVSVSELTLGVDGALPQVAREAGALYAGRGRGEQAAIGRLLIAIDELLREVNPGALDD